MKNRSEEPKGADRITDDSFDDSSLRLFPVMQDEEDLDADAVDDDGEDVEDSAGWWDEERRNNKLLARDHLRNEDVALDSAEDESDAELQQLMPVQLVW